MNLRKNQMGRVEMVRVLAIYMLPVFFSNKSSSIYNIIIKKTEDR